MPGNITVLNVDDQEPQRYVKTRDLRQSGFEVIEATSGAQALRMVEEHDPAVVLLDLQLPDVSGFEVCRHVKAKWPSVMILMTSATFTTSAHRTLGLDSGADSFLVNPPSHSNSRRQSTRSSGYAARKRSCDGLTRPWSSAFTTGLRNWRLRMSS
jgi:DNA-binding response OmpR family regulator